jgi:hypothetical protein
MHIDKRLAEFFRRLAATPAASNAREALALVSTVLDQVEEQFSGMPRRAPPPGPGSFDGRMHPPLNEHVASAPDGGLVALTRGHRILCSANGAIRIQRRAGPVVFLKPGKDLP